jgi:hypothetical protein
MEMQEKQLAIHGGEKAIKTPLAARHHFGEAEKAACNRVLDAAIAAGKAPGYGGPEKTMLCKEFAELLGGGYAECVNSGTGSVYVALRSLDLQPFTEVICPPVTDPGGMMPIVMMGCIPVVADGAPDSFNMSFEGVKKAYSPRTSAILVAHIAGEPCEDIEKICAFAKEKGLLVVLNPAPANAKIKEYLSYVDIIVPNETELEILGGITELCGYGIKTIITTLGSKGYEIYKDGKATRYPCIDIKAVDTTAAGDTACGGLCVGLSMDNSLEDAIAFGSKAASIACTRNGAQKS